MPIKYSEHTYLKAICCMFKIHILLTFLSVSENDDIDIKKIDL